MPRWKSDRANLNVAPLAHEGWGSEMAVRSRPSEEGSAGQGGHVTTEQRRVRVAKLLQEGSDRKLQLGMTAVAREKLQEAQALCHDLPPPWLALVAYRLAHLEMRNATAKQHFDEAEGLFLAAARSKALGPWPRLYRLAAMAKAGATPQQLRAEFDRAVTAIAEWRVNRAGPDDVDPRLQDEAHNLLELSAYFLGLPTGSLDGEGAISRGADDWILVGPDAVTATVRYSRELALEELDARAEREPKAVVYRLDEDGRNGVWRLPGSGNGWKKPRQDLLRLLALLQARRLREGPLHEQMGMNMTRGAVAEVKKRQEAFAQVKKRLCDALALGPRELWVEDAGRLQPGPKLRAFGAVSLTGLDPQNIDG